MECFRSSAPYLFLRKGVLKICHKFTGEHPCLSAISIKLQSNFIEITLRHECSPVNLLHIFRTLFLKTPLEGCFWMLALRSWKGLLLVTYHVHHSRLAFPWVFAGVLLSFGYHFNSLLFISITGVYSEIPCSSPLHFVETRNLTLLRFDWLVAKSMLQNVVCRQASLWWD